MQHLLSKLAVALGLAFTTSCVSVSYSHHGEPLEGKRLVSYSVVEQAPADHFEQTLFVEATVVAVCQKAGCWMQIEDGGETAMVRWESGCGGKYAFPADAVGKRVHIQGSFYPKTISPEDVEHLQSEAAPGVVIPQETWEFNASAVLIYD